MIKFTPLHKKILSTLVGRDYESCGIRMMIYGDIIRSSLNYELFTQRLNELVENGLVIYNDKTFNYRLADPVEIIRFRKSKNKTNDD